MIFPLSDCYRLVTKSPNVVHIPPQIGGNDRYVLQLEFGQLKVISWLIVIAHPKQISYVGQLVAIIPGYGY